MTMLAFKRLRLHSALRDFEHCSRFMKKHRYRALNEKRMIWIISTLLPSAPRIDIKTELVPQGGELLE
jgi:hypothetical protein